MKFITILFLIVFFSGFSQKGIDALSYLNKDYNDIITDSTDVRGFDDFYIIRKTGFSFLDNNIDKHILCVSKDNKINRVDLFFHSSFTDEFYEKMIKLYGNPLEIKKVKSKEINQITHFEDANVTSYKIEYEDCELTDNPETILWGYKGTQIILKITQAGSFFIDDKEKTITEYQLIFREEIKH